MHLGQVGEAALGEGAQQVQRRRRLLVGRHQALGIGAAGLGLEGLVVDHVAAEGRQLQVADPLGGRRARLGELPGDAADLDHGHAGGVGQRHRHLQNDLELVPDGVGRELGEGLGAVAGLEQEGLAVGHLGQLRCEVTGLAGEDEGRDGGEPRLGLLRGRPRRATRAAAPRETGARTRALQEEAGAWLVTGTG